ncbi:MAG: anaerobic ribonucleoside-triphosphate reductase activating protein [Candidatus Pacearchaeota archaeon]
MKIAGFQKITLIDYPSKVSCIIFLWGCNFRCGFCYNPDLVIREKEEEFSKKEILKFLEKRKDKLEAVCITGGEPLLSIEENFLKEIKKLGYLIKIDTNGSYPEKLKDLIKKNLVDYIAMDIKASRENYPKVTGIKVNLNKIEESIKIVYEFGEYEFRTTVVPRFHNEKEIEEIGKWVNKICNGKPKKHFLQGFKNKGNFIDDKFKKEKEVEEKFLKRLKKIDEEYFENGEVRI